MSECKHIFNAHAQCQWCHRMKKDIEYEDMKAEIERLQTDRNRYEDQLDRLHEWMAAAEDGYDKQKAEIASLNQQLDAAVSLLQRPERVTWGYDSDHRVMAYFLDGKYAGDTLRDVILAAATEGIKS